VNAPFRRGECPGLSRPMPTGDGLLVRLMPTGATIPAPAFAVLCGAARSCGSGVIEITSRGSIQVRGLTESSARRFAASVGELHMALSDDPPILCDPLAGLDPAELIDAGTVAADLRGAMSAEPFATKLGPKVSVVIDGGGALHLDAVAADVRLRAQANGGRMGVHVAVGGDAATAMPVGVVAAEHAHDAAASLLRVIAARGNAVRARDTVATEGATPFRQAIAHIPSGLAPASVRPPADPVGQHALRNGRIAVGFSLAFGHADATTLEALARAVADAGGSGLRTAPGRALLVVDVDEAGARYLTDTSVRLGLIVDRDDARRCIVACAGAPVCAAAEIPSRALAPSLAAGAAIVGADPPTVHVSGCAKGCACARTVPVTVVGIDGRCGVVVNGSARDRPLVTVMPGSLPAAVARLADTVRRHRAPGESAADVLSRLDRGEIARLILGEETGV
jgi:precorrin-3B synthase